MGVLSAARRGRWRIHRRRELPASAIAPLTAEALPLAPIFKEEKGHRVGVAALAAEAAEHEVVVKERVVSLWRGLLHLLLRSPLERAWEAARALEVRRLPAPRALALLVEHRLAVPVRARLVSERVAGAVPLGADLLDRFYPHRRGDGARGALKARIVALAQLVRELHESGLYHRDLNPSNLLVAPDGAGGERLLLVDLDSLDPGRRLTLRRRRKNLVQLGLIPEGHISARDRLRFLHAYDGGDGHTWNRDSIAALDAALADEIVRIIARMSLHERRHGAEGGDPRFVAEELGRER
ncbi:MAG: lipopolysaccharide kinase InaA family protein [Planctomycetota bacterium]